MSDRRRRRSSSSGGSGGSSGDIDVITPAGTSSVTSVNAANSDTSLLASNASRLAAYFFNDSTAILYLLFAASGASATNYTVQIPPGGYYEIPVVPIWTGAVRGFWSAANGAVRITELTT